MTRLVLDFSVIASGGSRSYAIGFLAALAEVGLPPGIACSVLLPQADQLLETVGVGLASRGINLHSVASGKAGTWSGRVRGQLLLPATTRFRRPSCVFVPREAAPFLLRSPFVILAHNRKVWHNPGSQPIAELIRWQLLNVTGRAGVRRASLVLVPSAAFAVSLPASPEKVRVVHHGCDLQPVRQLRAGPPTNQNPLRVLALGTLSPHKRLDRVIGRVAALRRLGVPTQIELWGPTPDPIEALRLRRLARTKLGEDPLRGPIDPANRADLLQRADVLAVGSTFESFGMTIVEALRTSTLVWAPSCALIQELCGSTAITFNEDGNDEDAAAMLVTALQNHSELVASGVERSMDFTWATCVGRTLKHLVAVSEPEL